MMKPDWLRRITVATIVPYHPDGGIDWESYARLLAYCTTNPDVTSVFVNGHAGENTFLSDDEKREILRFTRQHIAAEQCLIAGVVANDTAGAVQQAKLAREEGADVLTLFPLDLPGMDEATRTQRQVAYARAVGEAVDAPMAIFQYPFTSPATHSTAALAALAALPWVVGIKEGSDSMTLYEDNLRATKAVKPSLAMMPSNFDWFMPQLAVGGDGILSGLASLAPALLAQLWRASESKDLDAMRKASDALYPLSRAIYAQPRADMYARMKVVLKHMGVIATDSSRSRRTEFSAAEREALIRAFESTGTKY
jgi:4-hydroxy-tetrahydrodipicolinate synthase